MSWSISVQIDGGRFVNEDAIKDYDNRIDDPSVREQFRAALIVAGMLADLEVLGASGEKYSVHISGHANPEHKKRPGWSNDSISISMTQV